MPEILSDIVDAYVFRRLNGRVQFLLLQRRPDVPMPQTWQGFHAPIEAEETTLEAARRAVLEMVGLNVSAIYSADYVNQFYDDYRDVLVLAPVLAVRVSPQAPVALGPEFRDCAWFDRDEATTRLPFSGQRWAVRHIDELMSIGEREAELYRLELPALRRPQRAPRPAPVEADPAPPVAVGEVYGEVPMPSDPTATDFPVLNASSIYKTRQAEEPALPVPEDAEPAADDEAPERSDVTTRMRNGDDVAERDTEVPAASATSPADDEPEKSEESGDAATENPPAHPLDRFRLRRSGRS